MQAKMKVVVTGGAGFIGSHIAEELVKRGYEVTVLDNFSAGRMANISHILKDIKLIRGDIRDFELLKKEFRDADFISHQAALRCVPESVDNPLAFNDVNINGHYNVLEAARLNNVKRVVFASSSSVYGLTNTFPQEEHHTPVPVSPYAITKLAGECYNKFFFEEYSLEIVSLRYFNVFGPKQDPKSRYAMAIPAFITNVLNDLPPIVHGTGEQSRDFTYVKNNVLANISAFTAKGISGEVINVSEGKTISMNKIIQMLSEITGRDIKAKHEARRQGDVDKTLGSIEKAKRLLNFQCSHTFEQGLKETLEWYRESYADWSKQQ